MTNDNWGSIARFGLFIVGSEAVPEAEWWAMVPPGVSVHAARITTATPWAQWAESRETVVLAPDLERGAMQFASMGLSAVVLAHSSSSIVGGPGWDGAVISSLQSRLRPGTQVSTNGLDCARALRACGVRRPFIVYPPWFGEKTMAAGETYFSDLGFKEIEMFRHVPEQKWAHIKPEDLYRNLMHMDQNVELLFDQIVAECPAEADGVLIVGTGLRCIGIIENLEETLGRPVVTANQASLWSCLGLAEINASIPGYGQLLCDMSLRP